MSVITYHEMNIMHIVVLSNPIITFKNSMNPNKWNLTHVRSGGVNICLTRYTFVEPPDGTFGTKEPDGSWTGMVGMVGRRVSAVTQ